MQLVLDLMALEHTQAVAVAVQVNLQALHLLQILDSVAVMAVIHQATQTAIQTIQVVRQQEAQIILVVVAVVALQIQMIATMLAKMVDQGLLLFDMQYN